MGLTLFSDQTTFNTFFPRGKITKPINGYHQVKHLQKVKMAVCWDDDYLI